MARELSAADIRQIKIVLAKTNRLLARPKWVSRTSELKALLPLWEQLADRYPFVRHPLLSSIDNPMWDAKRALERLLANPQDKGAADWFRKAVYATLPLALLYIRTEDHVRLVQPKRAVIQKLLGVLAQRIQELQGNPRYQSVLIALKLADSIEDMIVVYLDEPTYQQSPSITVELAEIIGNIRSLSDILSGDKRRLGRYLFQGQDITPVIVPTILNTTIPHLVKAIIRLKQRLSTP